MKELEHRYGANVHILDDLYLRTQLTLLCEPSTGQPRFNQLVQSIYTSFLHSVVNAEFPQKEVSVETRMSELHPKEAIYQARVIDFEQPVICVNLARAGSPPSQNCYDLLNGFMNPSVVRQDFISIARATDEESHIVGSLVFGHKIGGKVDSAIMLFPDPMAATGSTMIKVLHLYRDYGKPLKKIALHCIVTPEYLKKVTEDDPELIVYALRLDRGLSAPDVLRTMPGERWNEEKGLNQKGYIVPGGGGFGELMNNSFV